MVYVKIGLLGPDHALVIGLPAVGLSDQERFQLPSREGGSGVVGTKAEVALVDAARKADHLPDGVDGASTRETGHVGVDISGDVDGGCGPGGGSTANGRHGVGVAGNQVNTDGGRGSGEGGLSPNDQVQILAISDVAASLGQVDGVAEAVGGGAREGNAIGASELKILSDVDHFVSLLSLTIS